MIFQQRVMIKEDYNMEFQEPKVEFIHLNADVVTGNSCTSDASANPSMQGCSIGSAHEQSCADEAFDWVD